MNLGGTDFLTLMLAQLKNQDPTSPIDSNQFLTQLAQLSEVQGISQLNTSFSTLASSLTSSQALQASSLLGTQVLVASSTASIQANGTVSGAVQVPQNTSDVVVSVADSSGTWSSRSISGRSPAASPILPGTARESDGTQAPAGTYTFSAQVAGAASGTAATTYINGLVQSVSMGGTATSATSTNGTTAGTGGLTLNVSGQGSVPFGNVIQIRTRGSGALTCPVSASHCPD